MSIKILKEKKIKNITDSHLQVKNLNDYEKYEWSSQKIVDALRDECSISKADAEDIANSVYNDIVAKQKTEIDISTLKNIINYHIFKKGFNGIKLAGQINIGMSLLDIDNLFKEKSNENSNISNNNPESLALTIVENTNKKYALKKVFSSDVSTAHLEGLIHIHDIGQITKSYCSAHSLRSIAMNGLGKFFGFDVKSAPAKNARALIGQLNTFMCSIAHFFAGAIGIDFVNIYLSPYVVDMTYKEIKQNAQHLIFTLSQSAFSRGGQVLFSDLNCHVCIPDWLKKVRAIGPGGILLNKTYGDFEKESGLVLKAMLEVYRDGDFSGAPFAFPKCDLHVCKNSFSGEAKKLLDLACTVSSENGGVYFVFDKDSVTLSACCRLKTKIDDVSLLREPERIRFSGIQNVSINLPQCAYRSGKDEKIFYKELDKCLDLVVKAHLQKKKFLKEIGSEPGSPMYAIVGEKYFDDSVYIDLNSGTYIVGIVGLNEAIKYLYGIELHENEDAHNKGLDVVTYLYWKIKKLSKDSGLKLSLEETPAESTARRLAKTDLLRFKCDAVYQGSVEEDNIYYTNSIHFRTNCDIDIISRIRKQSEYHPLIESGSIIHLFVGENLPSHSSVFNLVQKTFYNTECSQLCISPEFTVCYHCNKRFNGLKDSCPKCKTSDVQHITRIVGYYSNVKNWNKSKQKELKDRKDGKYELR
jgi:ribonucleoside-triphosphate reductase